MGIVVVVVDESMVALEVVGGVGATVVGLGGVDR
jgi:hypothetical protein